MKTYIFENAKGEREEYGADSDRAALVLAREWNRQNPFRLKIVTVYRIDLVGTP